MSREVTDHIRELYSRHEALEKRIESMVRPGTVADLDFSDPTKPRARIQHGTDDTGAPVLGPWLPWLSHAGEMVKWEPVTHGQQMLQFAPDGIFENGMLVPYAHSQAVPSPSTDPDHHVTSYGQHGTDHAKDSFTRTIGGTSDHQDTSDKRVNVPGKIEQTAGDPAAAASTGVPPAGGLMPHELNRMIQSIVARLGQHDHFHAAHHDQMSIMVDLGLSKIPAWASLQASTLNHTPEGLQLAAQQVLPRLPDFMALSIMQAVEKLASSFLGSVVETAQANIQGQITTLLGNAQQLLSGLTGAEADTAAMIIGQAQLAAPAAASGGSFELGAQLQQLTNLAAGTPAATPLAAIVGQVQGIMGSTSSLMSGLSGLLDSQDNAAQGTIKSMLLGGYGS